MILLLLLEAIQENSMRLTQLERFKATVKHEKHEGVLFYADFTPDLKSRIRKDQGIGDEVELREHFGMFAPQEVSLKAPPDYSRLNFEQYYKDIDVPQKGDIDSIGVLHIPGSMYHFTRYISPLRNATSFEEIENFPYPDFTSYSDKHMAAETKKAHDDGKVIFGWDANIYEDAWQIRGYEQFLMDMIVQPDWCEFILDKFTERNVIRAEAAARAGADYIITGDDVANQTALMFDIKLWRKFIKSRWAKVYQAAKQIKPDIEIWYHSDGNITDIIPELIEIGVTILNPIQPECLDPRKVKAEYGEKLVLDGSIGTQTTMPFGSAGEVKALVKERISTLG
jgi:uroporphyrinogen decarboxylase